MSVNLRRAGAEVGFFIKGRSKLRTVLKKWRDVRRYRSLSANRAERLLVQILYCSYRDIVSLGTKSSPFRDLGRYCDDGEDVPQRRCYRRTR